MKSKRSRREHGSINNIIAVSDLHCGCKLGLCPNRTIEFKRDEEDEDGVTLEEGGYYKPSKIQRKVWGWWEEFWGDWVPKVTHGEPYAIVINGDAVEGVHHRATTPVSHHLEDQADIAYEVLKPLVELCEGRFYMIRGTPAHVGEQGIEEERLAKRLGAIRNAQGQRSRYELWKRCGEGLVHFNHHIGTTASAQHETSAINAELATAFVEAGRWGNEPPDVIVRSHRHRCAEVRIPSRKGYAVAFVTAAWQLKTPYLYKVAGGRQTMPQIGGSIIRQGDEELHTRHKTWDIERPEPE